jgi:hypothetical protein
MRKTKLLYGIAAHYKDTLTISCSKDTVKFKVIVDDAGNTFKITKQDLLKLMGG